MKRERALTGKRLEMYLVSQKKILSAIEVIKKRELEPTNRLVADITGLNPTTVLKHSRLNPKIGSKIVKGNRGTNSRK